MSVRVLWDNEQKTIVRYVVEGKWTWEEMYPAYNQAIEMEKAQPHRVHVILDMRKAIGVPANVMMHMKNISDKQPANIGLSVFVTNSSFIHSLYQIGIKFYNKIEYYFRVAETLETAYSMIAEAETQYSHPA
ncbi:MAG: hypothetical protein U0694_19695 [Anaerolineae bacterium]